MAYAAGLKPAARKGVRVQPPFLAPHSRPAAIHGDSVKLSVAVFPLETEIVWVCGFSVEPAGGVTNTSHEPAGIAGEKL